MKHTPALMYALAAVAQTLVSSETATAQSAKATTVTLVGCVIRAAQARTFTLSILPVDPPVRGAVRGAPGMVMSAAGTQKPPSAPTGLKIELGGGTLPDPRHATVETVPGVVTLYRLTGADVSDWTGKRVRAVGVVVPSARSSNTIAGKPGEPLAEFRVQSVLASLGTCAAK
jgi:hypothetical protein